MERRKNGRARRWITPLAVVAATALGLAGCAPSSGGSGGGASADISGQTIRIQSSDADATVHALYGLGVYPHNLEVAGLGLEQAFVAITEAEEAKEATRS